MEHFDPKAIELLVEYVYTSQIRDVITGDNVHHLLATADLLELFNAKEECCQFLLKSLDLTNCLTIKSLAVNYDCPDLLDKSNNYIEHNFEQFVNCDEFYNLNGHDVSALIASDNINVSNEVTVYQCVISWVKHDLETRNQFLPTLMEHVRLPLMSQKLLENIKEPLLKAHPVCQQFITEALNHLNGKKLIPASSKTTPRRGMKAILVIGRSNIECYNFQTEQWVQIGPTPQHFRSALFVNGLVFSLDKGLSASKTVAIYNPYKKEWSSAPNLKSNRGVFGAAALDSCIYAIGGLDENSQSLSTSEVLDLSGYSANEDGSRQPKGEWKPIANMSMPRYCFGVGALKGQLYAVGGFDENSGSLASVEAYDPKQDSWERVADMNHKREAAGVGIVNGLLYAVGGWDGSIVRQDVECYNPDLNQWTYVSPMNIARRSASVVTHDGLLYAIGGWGTFGRLQSVEVFNPETNIWTVLPANISGTG